MQHRREGGITRCEIGDRPYIEPHVVTAVERGLAQDGAGHDVTGQQLIDEPLATGAAQQGTMTAQRFSEQRTWHSIDGKRSRVKLNELDIGHRHPGAQRHGDSVTGGFGRVRGDGEQLTCTAGGQQGVRRSYRPQRSIGLLYQSPAAGAAVDDQVNGETMLVHHGRGAGSSGDKRTLDLRAGRRAAGVHHPRVAVAPFPRELQRAVGITIELGAQVDELAHAGRTVFDEHADRVLIAEPGARLNGVGIMLFGRVGLHLTQHRGHPTLRPAGSGLGDGALGDYPDSQTRSRGAAPPRSARRSRYPR